MKIGIIGAMSVEVELLKERMQITRTQAIAGMEFFEGTIGNTAVTVVRSGVGKVNAAVCAQILITHFCVTHIINTGVAGSLDSRMDICDILVSADAVQHDVNAAVFGYLPGEIPGMGILAFEADPFLRKEAVSAARSCSPERHVYEGRVASGDRFISSLEDKNAVKAAAGGECCEMEGAAIAQTCFLNRIPFVIIRVISDKPGQTSTMEYNEIEAAAARSCAGITFHMLESMGK